MQIPEWLNKFILKSWSESSEKGKFAIRFETKEEIDEFIGLFPRDFIKGSAINQRLIRSNAYMFLEGQRWVGSADASLDYFRDRQINVINYSDVQTPNGEY